MARTPAFILVFVLGALVGAGAYHLFMTRVSELTLVSATAAYRQARQDADSQALRAYLRQIATAIEIARIDSPDVSLPEDCTLSYEMAGVRLTPITPLISCSVTVDGAGKFTIRARSQAGAEHSLIDD